MRFSFMDPVSTVSIRVVRSLVRFVENVGVPRVDLLRDLYLADEEEYDAEDARVSSVVFLGLCERAVVMTGDPALALHWHEATAGGPAYAPVSTMTTCAPTLREALALLYQYGPLLSDPFPFEEIDRGASIAIRLVVPKRLSERASRFAAEFTMLGVHRLLAGFAPRARLRVSFAHAAPDHRAEYRRLLGLDTHFSQPHTELVIDRALLEARGPNPDEDLLHPLQQLADRRMIRLASAVPFSVRVREVLVVKGANRVDMSEVARVLGLSARTLRRRLDAEGIGYHQLVLEAMSIIARRFLCDDGLTIQQTAQEMGYCDVSAFHRAFKRWTGETPSHVRAQQ